MALSWRWKLETGAASDLAPSMQWRAPASVQQLGDDQGPVLMIIEYRVDPGNSGVFLDLMHEIGHERMRDGAYAWNIYHDPDDLGRFVETSHLHSLLELKYRATRVTKADQLIEEHMGQFVLEAPREVYLIASKREHRAWRKRISSRAAPARALPPQ
jgi:hypothetical protein